MRRIGLLTLGILGVFVVAGPLASASAATFQDVDLSHFLDPVGPGETISGKFDITPDGFNPSQFKLTSASVSFTFVNFGDDLQYTIDLGNGDQMLGAPPSFSIFDTIHVEFAMLNGTALDDLGEDGMLAWSVTNTAADEQDTAFMQWGCHTSWWNKDSSKKLWCDKKKEDKWVFKVAKLKAVANPIPEPSAAVLFGVGIGVVGTAVRRRWQR